MAAREEDACCSSEVDDTDELASFLEARLEEVAGNSEQTSKKFERIVAEFGVSRRTPHASKGVVITRRCLQSDR